MQFFVGLHQPHDAVHFERCCISINRLRGRQCGVPARDWIIDSGAFSTLLTYGGYPREPDIYAQTVERWRHYGNLMAAVSEDYMCEPHMLKLTGLSVAEHQRLTIERYDALRTLMHSSIYLLPVLQGYDPSDYLSHLNQYGDRLSPGMWTGVGSVCKRNGTPDDVLAVLRGIKRARPDLRLHGFGLKITALSVPEIHRMLHSSDSMAWSFHARKNGRDPNDYREALRFVERIEDIGQL